MQAHDEQGRLRRGFALSAVAVLVFAGWIAGGFGGETATKTVDDVATVAAALVACVLCARSALRSDGRVRLFWSLLAAACGAWTLGEAIWGLYDLVLGDAVPVPSWADAAYLAALPPAAGALLAHPAVRGRTIGKLRSVLDGLVIAASIFFLAWVLLLEPLSHTTDLGTLGGAVTLAYPLGDVVILFLVVLVVRGTTGHDRLDLWCLVAGLAAITLSDAMYGYLTQVKEYSTGDVIDTGWFAGYLCIALAAASARLAPSARPAVVTRPLTAAALVTPFVPLLAALTLPALRIHPGGRHDGVTRLTALALAGLVLVRQLLLVLDLRSSDLVAAVGRSATEQP